jgi:glycosyltransferase involved in cell wall biosynthesis
MPPAPPLKIVHVAATATGAPWMVALMREQKRLGHDVAAIIPAGDGGIGARLDALGIPYYVAGVDVLFALPRLTQKIPALVRLARLLRRIRPDVVHSHIVNSVVTARLASWLADVPMHLGANAHPMSMESDVLRALEVGTSFCDTATIASCTYTRDLMLQHGVAPERLELIYYAVDQSAHEPSLADGARVRAELGLGVETPVVGDIAYFYPPARSAGVVPSRLEGRGIKGHDVLIRAMPRVLESVPEAKLILVGRGWGASGVKYEQELKDLANGVGAGASIHFIGERNDVPDLLAAFDVAVQCSLSDNLGGTVESLLMARPTVVSDIDGFRDSVLHEETGLAARVDDPESLADAIVRLLRDRELAQRLGRNGRQRALERFTLARTVADTEALLARRCRTAVDHYRLRVSVARAMALPFRLTPVFAAVYRGLRRHGFTLRRFAWQRLVHAMWRAVTLVRKPRVTASDRT